MFGKQGWVLVLGIFIPNNHSILNQKVLFMPFRMDNIELFPGPAHDSASITGQMSASFLIILV